MTVRKPTVWAPKGPGVSVFLFYPKKEVSAEKRTSDLRKVHTMKSMNYYVRTLILAILGGCAIPLAKKLKEE